MTRSPAAIGPPPRLSSPERRYFAPRRQLHGGFANTTVEKQRYETKKAELSVISISCRIAQPQHIEITKFPERHFWHGGYDKAHP
jgi:hypothetical protein